MTLVVPSLRSPSYFAASYPFKILYTSMIFLCFLCVRNPFGWPKNFQILCPKHFKNPGQIHLNPAKIDAKTSQNRAQDAPKSRSGGVCDLSCVLGASRGRLGAPWGRLGASWGLLVSWGRLGASWGASWNVLGKRLGPSGGRLGASWGRLGPVLGPSWGRLGSLGASWERLGRVLGPS